MVYCYGCEPKTKSLITPNKLVNRLELQLEFDQIVGLSQIRMLDLDQQEQFRAIVLQNALVLVQGNPLNPLGIITAIAGVYGVMQGGTKVSKAVKTGLNKRKVNNG